MTPTSADPFNQSARGEPIAGSQLYRNFCSTCAEPIRVPLTQRFARTCRCLCCVHKGRLRRGWPRGRLAR